MATSDLRIFLSYRREDTPHVAGRLRDRLVDRFGEGQVFMDVDSIGPGLDFAEAIDRAVADCDVLMVLIGPRWTEARDEHGRRRLDDPDDFVVLEVRAALERDVRVIPVLADGVAMPRANELPPAIRGLARRNATRLDHESFSSDFNRLLKALVRTPAVPPAEDTPREVPPLGGQPSASVLVAVVLLVLLAALALAASAVWLPREYDGFVAHARLKGTEEGLVLPAVAALLGLGLLPRRNLLPFLCGTLAAAALWSLIFWAKKTTGGLATVGVSATIEGTFMTGHWARLVAGLLLAIAVVVLVEGSPALRGAASVQRGLWPWLAGAVVVAGSLIPFLELFIQWETGSPAVVLTAWPLMALACVPVAALRFNAVQRSAVLTGATALCVFTAAREAWVIATQPAPPHFTVITTATAIVLAGCFLGQARPQRHTAPRPAPAGG